MKTYPLFKVHVPKEDALKRIGEVFDSGYINEGAQVTELTNALSEHMQTKKLVLVNSCTSALTLALKLAGVRYGDEVISTPMTCVATNTPIATMGARIVWADINPNSGMIDPSDVALKFTKKTKAVMAVAWAGTPPELSDLQKQCQHHGVKLILDAAHAFDARYWDMPIHKFADFTCYSFQAIKHFTTGDGGALVCNDDRDHQRAKALKWFGLDRDHAKDEKGEWKGQQWDADIVQAGFKFNMNNVSAAIGLAQMKHIDHLIATHRKHAAQYDELFKGCSTIVPSEKPFATVGSSWVYTVLLRSSYIPRDVLLSRLNAEGIMAGVVHVPNDGYTAFKDRRLTELPGVEQFSSNQFSLPCGWWLDADDVKHIAERVTELSK